jgi:hypothetical protein
MYNIDNFYVDNVIKKNDLIKNSVDDIKSRIIDILDISYNIVYYSKIEIEKILEDNKDLLSNIVEITNSAFWINMDKNDVKNHILKADKVFFVFHNEKIIWFSSVVYFGKLVYRFWTAIDRNYQGKGLYKKITRYIYSLHKEAIYFLRTQNQNVIKSLKSEFNVLIGKQALDFLIGHWLNIDSIEFRKFKNEYLSWELTDQWIFKKAYPWRLWINWNVNFITDSFYPWVDVYNGDSLLVVYY